jgi:hypothetical protein
MSAKHYINDIVFDAALKLLPTQMDSPEARALMLAIGLQESRFEYRAQVGGPAEGFWQFESGGGWKGVLKHPDSAKLAQEVLKELAYGEPDLDDYYAIENNDILSCVFARLLLWTHPKALPKVGQHDYAWGYYIELWRPGKPHRKTWDAFYDEAWAMNLKSN